MLRGQILIDGLVGISRRYLLIGQACGQYEYVPRYLPPSGPYRADYDKFIAVQLHDYQTPYNYRDMFGGSLGMNPSRGAYPREIHSQNPSSASTMYLYTTPVRSFERVPSKALFTNDSLSSIASLLSHNAQEKTTPKTLEPPSRPPPSTLRHHTAVKRRVSERPPQSSVTSSAF